MRAKILLSIIALISATNCSVYKSQGRRNFETDVPTRVPIAVVFHCPNSTSASGPDEVMEWETLKKAYPDLTVQKSIDNQTVILLARTVSPQRTCISEGLDLTDYEKNFIY